MNMEYFDVVLFSPPSRMINHYRPPVSLLCVGGYLMHMGLKVRIIDVPIKKQIRDKEFRANYELIVQDIRRQMIEDFKNLKTKIVGITCYSTEFVEVLTLIKDIKRIDPSVKIIIGGIHPTLMPTDFFEEDTGADICVVGEGEITLYELVQRILINPEKGFDDIKGIVFKDELTKKVKINPLRPLVENLDDISFSAYSLIDMEYYTNASPYSIRGCYLRSMYALANRGCPFQCTFCVAKKLRECSGKGSPGRARSAGSLISELKELKHKYKIDAFYFIDDMFTIDKENVKEFCSRLGNENLNLLWGCNSRVSTLDEELIENMAKSGCIQIDFGVERGSDQALRFVKKGTTIKKIIETFDLCHKYGIRTFANMLINVPGETEQDLTDILNLLDRIKPEVVFLNIFFPFPGTEIYENAPYKFKREEYYLLSQDIGTLLRTHPEKFRFVTHSVDMKKWESQNYRKYNSPLRNVIFHLSLRYWKTLLKSGSKMNYVKQFSLFANEFINQKFNPQ